MSEDKLSSWKKDIDTDKIDFRIATSGVVQLRPIYDKREINRYFRYIEEFFFRSSDTWAAQSEKWMNEYLSPFHWHFNYRQDEKHQTHNANLSQSHKILIYNSMMVHDLSLFLLFTRVGAVLGETIGPFLGFSRLSTHHRPINPISWHCTTKRIQ